MVDMIRNEILKNHLRFLIVGRNNVPQESHNLIANKSLYLAEFYDTYRTCPIPMIHRDVILKIDFSQDTNRSKEVNLFGVETPVLQQGVYQKGGVDKESNQFQDRTVDLAIFFLVTLIVSISYFEEISVVFTYS